MEQTKDWNVADVERLLDAVAAEQHSLDLAFAEREAQELTDYPEVEEIDIDLTDDGFVIRRREVLS